ncbi:MAG: hypothetical protein ABIE94_00780 [archaeon]
MAETTNDGMEGMRTRQTTKRHGASYLGLGLLLWGLATTAAGCTGPTTQADTDTTKEPNKRGNIELAYNRAPSDSIDKLVVPTSGTTPPIDYETIEQLLHDSYQANQKGAEQNNLETLEDATKGYNEAYKITQRLIEQGYEDETLNTYNHKAALGLGSSLFEAAQLMEHAGNTKLAETTYSQAQKIYETLAEHFEIGMFEPNAEAYSNLGDIFARQGNHTDAAESYWRAGTTLLDEHQDAEAQEEYEKAAEHGIDLDGKNPYDVGNYYTLLATKDATPNLDLLKMAETAYLQSAEQNPENVLPYSSMINNLIQYFYDDTTVSQENENVLQRALSYCNTVLGELKPTNPEILHEYEMFRDYCTGELADRYP